MKLQITKNQEHFEELRWVARALSPDKADVPFVNHIFKDGNFFVATDRSRLHFCRPANGLEFSDGLYEVVRNNNQLLELNLAYTKTDKRHYPDILQSVVKWTVPENSIELVYDPKSGSSKAFTTIIRKMKENTINYTFLDDILSCGECFDVWQEDNDPAKPINFKNGTKFAALMPLRED